jgi:hypothetical protein
MGNKEVDVHVMICQNFLNQLDGSASVPEGSKNISVYNEKPSFHNLTSINFGQVAKVCDTDAQTIESIF